jgi:hypothetical protein
MRSQINDYKEIWDIKTVLVVLCIEKRVLSMCIMYMYGGKGETFICRHLRNSKLYSNLIYAAAPIAVCTSPLASALDS